MGILVTVEKLKTASFELEEERVAWEGLAASCAGPIRRLGAFVLVGFVSFVAATTAMVLFYNLFGDSYVDGAGVTVPQGAFYTTMLLGLLLAVGGYLVWLIKSLHSYRESSEVTRFVPLPDEITPSTAGTRERETGSTSWNSSSTPTVYGGPAPKTSSICVL